jgi:hypothetical protein
MRMHKAERDALVEQYTRGPSLVRDALAGISDAELDARHDGWTAREVVHHLADSEMTSAIRLRRLLAEDHPTIHGYDQAVFARVLAYADRPIDAALDAISAARRTTAEILARMTDADWAREGTHTQSGRYSAEDWLRITVTHGQEHAAQLDAALRIARTAKA